MKINMLILLTMVLFIIGCTIKTTGNVVIEDTLKQSAEEKKEAAETTTTTIQEAEKPKETTTTTTVASSATTIPTGNTISIENLKFVPDKLRASKGTTITWKHNDKYVDNMKHMIRIYPIGAASPQIFYGESFSYTFNESGEYTVIDIIYREKNVRGKVIVE